MAHIPERMCVGCRKMLPKDELIRLALEGEEVTVDIKQKIQARGVYICKKNECVELAKKKKALSRAFKRNVSDGVYDLLSEVCSNG